jgi:uncharacterized SAM-binding protein YcdF (DUF218 family)
VDGLLASKLVAAWLLPPALQVALGLLGLLLLARWRRLGVGLLALAVASLALLGLPAVGGALLASLERYPALDRAALRSAGAEAVVVLSSGRNEDAPEYGDDTVDAMTLERLRYGARVQRVTGLPLLLSGALVRDRDLSLAFLMKEALVDDFRVPVAWTEEESRNTWQNARYSGRILEREGIRRVLLVTHAWHMPRAVASFRGQGLDPVPAPTGFTGMPTGDAVSDWVPSSKGLRASYWALHEYLGLAWYRLRYGGSGAP